MKKFIIPLLVILVGFLCFTVYEQTQQRNKLEMIQIVEDNSRSFNSSRHEFYKDERLNTEKTFVAARY